MIWAVLDFSSSRGRQSRSHFGKKNKHKKLSFLSVGRGDASPGAPPRLGELWVTDATPDSLRLSWTVPEGHFDSFVVQFKDRDGPRVVSVEGHERSVTISPLDSGRKYRFLVYGLLGKRRHGPLTTEGTTGEGSPCGGRLIWRAPWGESLWSLVVAVNMVAVWLWLSGWNPTHLLAQARRPSPAGRSHSSVPSLDLSVLPFSVTQPSRNNHLLSVFPSQRPAELWMRLEQSVPQNHVWGRSCR